MKKPLSLASACFFVAGLILSGCTKEKTPAIGNVPKEHSGLAASEAENNTSIQLLETAEKMTCPSDFGLNLISFKSNAPSLAKHAQIAVFAEAADGVKVPMGSTVITYNQLAPEAKKSLLAEVIDDLTAGCGEYALKTGVRYYFVHIPSDDTGVVPSYFAKWPYLTVQYTASHHGQVKARLVINEDTRTSSFSVLQSGANVVIGGGDDYYIDK